MSELEGFQRKHLRGLAHPLKPIIQVGAAGLSEAVLRQVDEALGHHELIKVRFIAPSDKKAEAETLAKATRSTLCGLVGHTVILYRAKPEEPQIRLPKR